MNSGDNSFSLYFLLVFQGKAIFFMKVALQMNIIFSSLKVFAIQLTF